MFPVLIGDRPFGELKLNRLTWQDIEQMYAAMRGQGLSVDWVRRSATVLPALRCPGHPMADVGRDTVTWSEEGL